MPAVIPSAFSTSVRRGGHQSARESAARADPGRARSATLHRCDEGKLARVADARKRECGFDPPLHRHTTSDRPIVAKGPREPRSRTRSTRQISIMKGRSTRQRLVIEAACLGCTSASCDVGSPLGINRIVICTRTEADTKVLCLFIGEHVCTSIDLHTNSI